MTSPFAPKRFIHDLERVAQARSQIAKSLSQIVTVLRRQEATGAEFSGRLGLESTIANLAIASQNLEQNVFRLLVLGDMKRGKSTLLNALLGKNLLPSDVNPCTALLTVLKYGPTAQVTIHFNNGKSPEQLDFASFKQRYTIPPEEAKILEAREQLAFPEVSHAVVEYPLPLLEKGIELVDSPGLNDTEARNQLSLNYINNCHAILFVLRAAQPCTLEERRYLANYIKDRGLTVFFLINAWDQVRQGLVDPDDPELVQEAEDKLRRVFRANLSEYCWANGEDLYSERVFEVSALKALRDRLQDPTASLEGSGFPEFLQALNQFLTQERAVAELQQARSVARQTYRHVCEAIERRIPLLEDSLSQLEQRIDSVQTEFAQLDKIRDQFQTEIRTRRDREAQEIADSFRTYILDLENSFEQDFLNAQPDLNFLEFLQQDNREKFYTAFKRAFERYMNDRLAGWEFIAKQKVSAAFTQLDERAADYRVAYTQVIEAINEKLIGQRFYAIGHRYNKEEVEVWSDAVMDLFSGIPDSLNGAVTSFNMFWQQVLLYLCIAIAFQVAALVFTSIALNVFAVMLAGMGVVALQAEYVRQQFLSTTKKEFVKYLPKIAEEQWETVKQGVKGCFDAYEQSAIQRVDDDIQARKAELDNLLRQKQSHEVDRETEIQRFQTLETEIAAEVKQVEFAYESLI